MTNEEFVRQAYAIAEVKDLPGWVACFNPDGVFVDESVGVTYRGPSEVGNPSRITARRSLDMHRELYDVYVTGRNGDVVVVELALQGTHDGPLWLPQGSSRPPATGWTPRAAMSFVSRTGGSSCSTVTRRAP